MTAARRPNIPLLIMGCDGIEGRQTMKREFGPKLKQFLIRMRVDSLRQADDILKAAEV